jgi:hypothetical protein
LSGKVSIALGVVAAVALVVLLIFVKRNESRLLAEARAEMNR